MSSFYVRVELHEPKKGVKPAYDELHKRMAEAGFSTAMRTPSGRLVGLPSGTYRIFGLSLLTVFNVAKMIATDVARLDAEAASTVIVSPDILVTSGSARSRLTTITPAEYLRRAVKPSIEAMLRVVREMRNRRRRPDEDDG